MDATMMLTLKTMLVYNSIALEHALKSGHIGKETHETEMSYIRRHMAMLNRDPQINPEEDVRTSIYTAVGHMLIRLADAECAFLERRP